MKTKPDSMVEKVKAFIRMPYAWPGGYPLFAITADGGVLCKHCGKRHAKTLISETRQRCQKRIRSTRMPLCPDYPRLVVHF